MRKHAMKLFHQVKMAHIEKVKGTDESLYDMTICLIPAWISYYTHCKMWNEMTWTNK